MSGLDELLSAARRALDERPGVALAMATLHAVDGSSYRQPGARLLVDADGRVLAGAVSGGCLEGDVAAYAAGVCASGVPKQLTYDLREDLQSIWGFGAMCDGIAHLLLEPLRTLEWLESAVACRHARSHGSLVTRVSEDTDGGTTFVDETSSTSLAPSLRALLDAARQTGAPVSQPMYDGASDPSVLVDPQLPPVSLIMVGAGRGAESFATIAHTLGWKITVIDHRPFVLENVALPEGARRVVARAEAGVEHVTRDGRTAVALLTHQFAVDAEWLTQLLPLPIGYVGVLGSRQRAAQLMDSLREGGISITPSMERLLHAPIGLDLGGEAPESIALSAIAEIEAVMHGRPGGALRERQSPIHSRTPTPSLQN